ncbi:hypothetical protein B9N62_09515 [Campylobacter concisus]|uniref:Uncharacterized protein n=1 Tax=Campylobacter concisus TaxID=199 RepID=A0A1Y5MTQ8_9BACT|nr:hypothetical protein [Campylobacter concisus]OUT10664.1 hypothetical protein B9N62_09515 [Campylobacter concisus]
MKKIGRISALNTRVVRQNSVVSFSIIVDKMRFSETFSPKIYKYEVGDLVEIKYKKVGFLNKIETIRLIAKSSEESGLFARIENLFFLLVALYLCFISLWVIYYGITLEFSIYRLIILLAAICFLIWMGKSAYLRLLIFRYFIFG